MSTSVTPAFLPFALPDVGEDEIAEVVDSLRSGWITTGPKTKAFEQRFAEYLGGDVEAIAVNSATAGLHLALEALGVGPGDEVITTTYTFTATAEVIRYLGAHPVFVDICPRTLNLNPSFLRGAVTPRTKAIIPVHFAGLACDMDAVTALSRELGIPVVEDAAHAFPTTVGGRLVGALDSAATVFSFYATKTLATGEGGMVVTRDPELARRCRIMRLHGISRDAFDRYVSTRPSWQYDVIAPGFKYNLSDLASSIGLHQLRRADALRDRREAMARRYDDGLAGLPLDLPPHAAPGDRHAWHLYVIRLRADAGIVRDAFIAAMADQGVGCSVHFIPLHRQPYWRDTYALRETDYAVASAEFERVVSLPLYTRMTDDDQDRVVEAVRAVLAGG